MGRDAPVERGARRDEIVAPDDASAAAERAPGDLGHATGGLHARDAGQRRDLVDVGQRARHRAQQAQGVARHAEQPAREQLDVAGLAVAAAVEGRRGLASLRAQIEERPEDLRPGEAVDDRVVDLAHDHGLAVAVVVDQVELPERARAIKRAAEDPRHLLGELVVVAGRRQRQLADVEVQVEVAVFDPVAVVEIEGHLDQPPAERRHERQALGDEALQVGQVERAAGNGRGVDDGDPAHVPVVAAVLEGQELLVGGGELTHGPGILLPGA